RLVEEAHVLHVALAELQAADAEAIVLGRAVLLDVAPGLERRQQTEDVVLVELEALGVLGHPELVGLAEELLQHVERVRDRLDDVVGFLASHVFTKRGLRLFRTSRGVNGGGGTGPRQRNPCDCRRLRARGGPADAALTASSAGPRLKKRREVSYK